MSEFPRVIIAGTNSGSGKTTVTCALLSLLKRRGVQVRACKCGPDYIDPMFHEHVLSVSSTNLDPFFCSEDMLKYLLKNNAGGDITVIEGVMGYYDGAGSDGTDYSTYSVSRMTGTSVILVVDAKGAAASLLAVIEGFLKFREDSRIAGVIFNRASKMTYAYLKKMMYDRFQGVVIPVGYIPVLPAECTLESRHLGLVTAGEIEELDKKIEKITDIVEETLEFDIEEIMKIARTADHMPEELSWSIGNCDRKAHHKKCGEAAIIYDPGGMVIPAREKIRIAVARDEAFCFYYRDTLELLKRMGAEITIFSPLKNEPVPEGACGLLIGGGYPELHAKELEANTVSRESIFKAVKDGIPTIAECGGFQYLGKSIDGRKMCGVLDFESKRKEKLVRFGYIELHCRERGLFGEADVKIRGHEFHYYDSTDNGTDCTAEKVNGKKYDCCFYTDTLYAGYPHLYLASDPEAAEHFYTKCLEYQQKATK